MPFQIRPLTTTERDTLFTILSEYFSFSVGLPRPIQQEGTDNIILDILLQTERDGLLQPLSEHPFGGVTVFCKGSHPFYAYAWSSAYALRSPLDCPTIFAARIGTDNKQRLLDSLVDLCPEDALQETIRTIEYEARQEKESERISAIDVEKHRNSIPPSEIGTEDKAFVHRAHELDKARDEQHLRAEHSTSTLLFLEKIRIRRDMSAADRASDYRLGQMHDKLFQAPRS